jgi:hypothetical protein
MERVPFGEHTIEHHLIIGFWFAPRVKTPRTPPLGGKAGSGRVADKVGRLLQIVQIQDNELGKQWHDGVDAWYAAGFSLCVCR